MYYCLLSLVVFVSILENSLIVCDIESDISKYYKSESSKSFQRQWEPVRKSFENALKIVLTENFGRKSLNTIERKPGDVSNIGIAEGFYLYDNVVHMIFHSMHIKEMPRIKNLDVYFPLSFNVLQIQTELSKMIVETNYTLMRNTSDVLFAGTNFDPNSNSPFTLQQVQDTGSLAILVEDCLLSGFVITKLIGLTVVLGHDTFKISDCKFTIEISAEGLGSPPVIAPYFSKEQRGLLENLMTKPIREELRSKLQSALFTYVNTSGFENDLVTFRKNQQIIFKETSKYINDFLRNENNELMETNKAAYNLDPLEVIWNATIDGDSQMRSIKLTDVVIDGFDSAYSPLIGGPYKMDEIGIVEEKRYNTLKVQGKIFFEHKSQTEHDFSMVLLDVTANIIYKDVGDASHYFEADPYISWRDSAFSITNVVNASERITAESIANGYLINEIPKLLLGTLLKMKKPESQPTQLSLVKSEHRDLERLSDISQEGDLNRIGENQRGKTQESIEDDTLDPDVLKLSLWQSGEDNMAPQPHIHLIDEEEEGRRRHKNKKKKHKRHGKRHQDKSAKTKKEIKQKKKIHSN